MKPLYWKEKYFGKSGFKSKGIKEEIGQKIGSTPYVLFTAINGRTERIFVNE